MPIMFPSLFLSHRDFFINITVGLVNRPLLIFLKFSAKETFRGQRQRKRDDKLCKYFPHSFQLVSIVFVLTASLSS